MFFDLHVGCQKLPPDSDQVTPVPTETSRPGEISSAAVLAPNSGAVPATVSSDKITAVILPVTLSATTTESEST